VLRLGGCTAVSDLGKESEGLDQRKGSGVGREGFERRFVVAVRVRAVNSLNL